MTRRDFWLGLVLLAVVILAYAAFPRYDWRQDRGTIWLRVDRWTGNAELVIVRPNLGTHFPLRPPRVIDFKPD